MNTLNLKDEIARGAVVNTLDILIAVRELIADESRWTQEAAARDAKGWVVHPRAEEACRWCVYGALLRISRSYGNSMGPAWELLDDVAREAGYSSPVRLNDECGHAAILMALDRAIERARTQS